MDLVRKILLAIEEEDGFEGDWRPVIDGHSFEEIVYHVELMQDAGFLVVDIQRFYGGNLPSIYLRRMTWTGHEFLDAARKESLWSRAKDKTMEATGGLGFDLLREALLDLGRQGF